MSYANIGLVFVMVVWVEYWWLGWLRRRNRNGDEVRGHCCFSDFDGVVSGVSWAEKVVGPYEEYPAVRLKVDL